MSVEMKRSYQSWSLDDDLRLLKKCKEAKRRKIPLTRLFEEISEEFGRKPQTIAQHYYTEIRPNEEELVMLLEKEAEQANQTRPIFVNNIESDYQNEAIGIPKEGAILEGTVENVAPFGVFIRLDNELRGLLHISQISKDFIEDINALFKVGERVHVRVENIDENGRLSFSTIGLLNVTEKQEPDNCLSSQANTEVRNLFNNDMLYHLMSTYCQLQDDLRQFQVKILSFQHLLNTQNIDESYKKPFENFIEKCLAI